MEVSTEESNPMDIDAISPAPKPEPNPPVEPRTCLWFFRFRPNNCCGETFTSDDTMLNHIMEKHIRERQGSVPPFTCMWHDEEEDSMPCRYQVYEFEERERWEGFALRDIQAHICVHVWRAYGGFEAWVAAH